MPYRPQLLTPLAAALAAALLPHAHAADVNTLDRVEVTAQRRAESAQDVGIAISVLSGDELKAKGIKQINQLQGEVPSLEIEPAFGSGQAQFRIRGIGFQDYGSNNASPVGVYVDEVGYAFPVQTQGLLFDLERVEVLRGPQGTLYGKNTTAGAVNLLSRRPTRQAEGGFSLGLGLGSNSAVQAQGYLSGPLADGVRGRLSVASERGGAWQTNRVTGEKLGDQRVDAVRGQLEVDLTRDLQARLTVSHNQDKSDAQGLYVPTARSHTSQAADADPTLTGWGLQSDFAQRIGVAPNAKPGRNNEATNLSLHVDWNLGAARLTSITAHQRFTRKELGDWDGTAVNHSDVYWQDRASVTTQELRLASAAQAALPWVVGAYYAKEGLDEDWWTDFRHDYGVITRTRYAQDGRTHAVFGQVDVPLAAQWTLVTGLRQEHETRSVHDFSTATVPVIPGLGVSGAASSLSSNQTSGKLALQFKPDAGTLLYASLSRGVKSGGITAHNTFNSFALTPFQPEKLVALEAGVKADVNRQFRVNASVFHYDYRDQQFQDVTTSPTGALIGKIINIARSKVDGGELELQWKPLAGLTIGQSLGYKHAVFKDFNSPLLGNLSGHDQFLPKLSYGGSVAYAWQASGLEWKAAADYSYRSRYPSWLNRLNVDGGTVYDVPAYWLANARLEVAPANSPWQATLGVRNLFNRRYDLTRNFFGNRPSTADDLNVAAAGQPRTWQATVSYSY